MASEAVKIVMNGFKNLNTTEQQEFIEVIKAYLNAGMTEKRTLEEGFTKAVASTGPLGRNTCKCCGR